MDHNQLVAGSWDTRNSPNERGTPEFYTDQIARMDIDMDSRGQMDKTRGYLSGADSSFPKPMKKKKSNRSSMESQKRRSFSQDNMPETPTPRAAEQSPKLSKANNTRMSNTPAPNPTRAVSSQQKVDLKTPKSNMTLGRLSKRPRVTVDGSMAWETIQPPSSTKNAVSPQSQDQASPLSKPLGPDASGQRVTPYEDDTAPRPTKRPKVGKSGAVLEKTSTVASDGEGSVPPRSQDRNTDFSSCNPPSNQQQGAIAYIIRLVFWTCTDMIL